MNRVRGAIGAVGAVGAVVLLTLCAVGSALAEDLVDDAGVASRIGLFESWAAEQMRYQHQPGVAVGVVHDGELIYARGFGLRDLERSLPMTPDTVLRLGSISKLFTAVAVLQLRDAGELDLDDPVSRHLPWFEPRTQFDEGPITIRQLLAHTSGLPREAPLPYWTNRAFPTSAELRSVITEVELVHTPGSAYQYSNLGIAISGEVVAAVSKGTFQEYVDDRLLAPLDMNDTAVGLEGLDPERIAVGYLIERDGERPVAPPTRSAALAPAADLSSTVGDLAKLVSALFPGSEETSRSVLRSSTLREMESVEWLSGSWSSARGLGFSIWREDERTVVGHGGWVAGYRSELSFDPQARIGVIVLTNSDEGGPGSYADQLWSFVVPAIERADGESSGGESSPVPASAAPSSFASYLGIYRNPWGEATEVLSWDDGIALFSYSYPPSRNPERSVTPLRHVDGHSFREGEDGRAVVFELRPNGGGVARVKVGENYLFPDGCQVVWQELRCEGER